MLYQIKDGTVSVGGQTILSHVDFYIREKEKMKTFANTEIRISNTKRLYRSV